MLHSKKSNRVPIIKGEVHRKSTLILFARMKDNILFDPTVVLDSENFCAFIDKKLLKVAHLLIFYGGRSIF